MSQFIIHLKDKEEEAFIETFLKRMEINFEKVEDDFELTDEMIQVIETALKQDKSKAVDGFEHLIKISKKYGI
jgi:hypothetical protein